ncbi:MAG: hypothetical protein IH840_16250, partial [Candidatus Heimdallarchaeota archaeon]|nr:hypothetical protein [Candidatus Heimdallarchaeota archaeon]
MSTSKSSKSSDVKLKGSVTLDDIIDLTVVELYILNFLVRIAGRTVRFVVFNELNSKLSKDRWISRSSFYNSLQKLERKGFVTIQANKDGKKGSLVGATALARDAIKQNNIFAIWGNIDLYKINVELIQRIFQEIGLRATDKILFASFDESINSDTLNYLKSLANETYLLGDSETLDLFVKRGEDIPFSRFERSIIREPNDYFDYAIVSKYHGSASLFGETAQTLLKELTRVVKPIGYVVLLSFDNLPITDNMILESVMSDLFLNDFFKPSTKQALKENILEAGLKLF